MNYEWATRVPLIISAPGFEKGTRSSRLVEYVDLFPTFCELTGADSPSYLEGTSMVPLLEEPERPWKKAVFFQYDRWGKLEGFGLRTERYRYVRWEQVKDISDGSWFDGKKGRLFAEELYDLENDPLETVNIAKDNPAVCAELHTLMKQGWKGALPEGIENHSDNEPAPNVTWTVFGTEEPEKAGDTAEGTE
jgi:iduronate 2-sulfatase